MTTQIHDLEPEIVALVGASIPKGAGGIGGLITIELVGGLVRSGLDAVVAQYGDQGVALSQAAKSHIRTFVSVNTLKYLQGIVAGMQDLKAMLPSGP
jgi:hypothetical protein